MFKKFAALQWTWFWLASGIIYFIQDRYIPNNGTVSNVLGNYYWAGLVVIFWTWIIKLIIKAIRTKNTTDKPNEHKNIGLKRYI